MRARSPSRSPQKFAPGGSLRQLLQERHARPELGGGEGEQGHGVQLARKRPRIEGMESHLFEAHTREALLPEPKELAAD